MASALDTLCGQSYGAKQHHMLGIHMQRAMLVLMIVSINLAFIWANTRSILVALGQDPEISAEAGQYAQLMIALTDFCKPKILYFQWCSALESLLYCIFLYVGLWYSNLDLETKELP